MEPKDNDDTADIVFPCYVDLKAIWFWYQIKNVGITVWTVYRYKEYIFVIYNQCKNLNDHYILVKSNTQHSFLVSIDYGLL